MPRGATNEQLARGRKRMKELAAEAEAERKVVEADLLASLGRPASALDRVLGRNDAEERRSIAQLMRASNFKPDRPLPAPKPDFLAEMRRAAGVQS
jgi:hypothetical protein